MRAVIWTDFARGFSWGIVWGLAVSIIYDVWIWPMVSRWLERRRDR